MSTDVDPARVRAHAIGAANAVFDELAAEIAERVGDDRGAPAGADPIGELALRTAGARLVDLVAGVFQESVEAYLELAQAIVGTPVASGSPGSGAGLSLRGRAGGVATTAVWLHSTAPELAGVVTLSMTDLQAAGGARIAGSQAILYPPAVRLDGGTSASSILTLAIAPRTPAGTYYGHVLAAGLPAGGLTLALVVEPAGG